MPRNSYQTTDVRSSEASAKRTISNDVDIDNNGRAGGRNSQLGRNPAYLAGNEHSGGHQSQGVYGDNSPPDVESGSNINGAADSRNWKGYGKSVPPKSWK